MKEGDTAVVYSPALEICGYGKTVEDAQKDFHNAVKIFFEETKAHGVFENALEQLGWKKINQHWRPGVEILSHRTEEIVLPA